MKTPAGEQLSPKRSYRIELASGRKCLALATGLATRPDAEAQRDRIATLLGYLPGDLVIVGSAPPAPAGTPAEEEAPW